MDICGFSPAVRPYQAPEATLAGIYGKRNLFLQVIDLQHTRWFSEPRSRTTDTALLQTATNRGQSYLVTDTGTGIYMSLKEDPSRLAQHHLDRLVDKENNYR